MAQCDFLSTNQGDALYQGDQLIGSLTSGAHGHRVQKNIAFAFFKPELAVPGTKLVVEILGQRQPAQLVASCLFDPIPAGERVSMSNELDRSLRQASASTMMWAGPTAAKGFARVPFVSPKAPDTPQKQT